MFEAFNSVEEYEEFVKKGDWFIDRESPDYWKQLIDESKIKDKNKPSREYAKLMQLTERTGGGDGAFFEEKLDKIYKTPSKNPDIISSKLSREDFPIYMNQYKNAYVTVEKLMNCIKDERVEFWYKGN